MKKTALIILAVLLVFVAAFVGCSLTAFANTDSAQADTTREIKIAHISDIHIMTAEYCNIYSEAYRKAGRTSYKVLEQTEAAVESVFAEMYLKADGTVKEAKDIPQYVMITGDLTSNGELANHLAVANLLTAATQKIRAIEGMEGFQIFVIPGNHDIDNQNAKAYNPDLDDAKWQQLKEEGNAQKMQEYLASLGSRSVQTTTMLQFMSIYSDFGYCNCPNKDGHDPALPKHLAECNMAEDVTLEFFYESDYWYVDNTTRSTRPVSLGADAVKLTDTITYEYEYTNPNNGLIERDFGVADAQEKFKVDKDMEYYAFYSRHGACSYIARVGGLTVVGLDSNSHKWTDYKNDSLAVTSSRGWQETTGGYVTKAQMCWLISHLDQDVKDNQLIVSLAHENVLPHFDTEDEVISLFTYDNWEDVYTNMADNGMRYVLTGHQHTNDIESAVSQSGNIFFDIETGSTTCMGAGWRELDFKMTDYASGAYSEDVYFTMHFLHYNSSYLGAYYGSALNIDLGDLQNAFIYGRYEVSESGGKGVYKYKLVYQGVDGGETDLAEYMALSLKGMITNIAGNFVNEKMMDSLIGLTSGLDKYSPQLADLAATVVDQLGKLNLHKFTVNADGTFEMGDISSDYHLTEFAMDLVDYFLGYDYSFGKVQGGLHLDDVLLYVYGNHLNGAQDYDTVPDDIQALITALENGQFLRYFEDLMLRGVMPQLEVILNAPIYWGSFENYRHINASSYVTADDVKDGKGFDLSAFAAIPAGNFKIKNSDTIPKMISSFIKTNEKGEGGMDISSLFKLLRSLSDNIVPILNNPVVSAALGDNLDKFSSYIDIAIEYLSKLNDATLTEVIQAELLDKYVTDAFCKNLGSYAAYIVRSVVLDDSLDGVLRIANSNKAFPYEPVEGFHLEVTHSDISAMAGHTYYRDAQGNDTVKVVATTQNGLLPGKITLTNVIDDDGNLDVTQKEIRWFTQRDVDYTQVCKQFEWSDRDINAAQKTFQCELIYSTDPTFADATPTVYTGVNEWIEYPTIDLGIMYLNMTYAYRQYNDFEVTLENLQPGKVYYYRIRSIDGDTKYDWTPTYQFTTGTTSGGFQIMAMTDIQGSIEQNYTASLPNMTIATEAGDHDFIISCGDNVDKSENISQWEWLLDDQASIWANNTFVGLAGNHEDKNFSLSYVTATPNTAKVDETGYYYSYNYQNVHFVILNTNDIQSYAANKDTGAAAYKGLGKTQYNWLVKDLAAAQNNTAVDFIVVALHKGPYTAGSHAFDSDVIGLRKQLTPVFAQYGVDIVLQGHDHTYSVSEYIGGQYNDQKGLYDAVDVSYDATGAAIDPSGVLYINLGTMGDKYYNYIYSPEVTLKDRSADNYLKTVFASYFTKDGNFELSPVRDSKTTLPETPVYAYLTVEGKRLSFASYTVINGASYPVDTITLTKDPVTAAAQAFKVGNTSFDADTLSSVALVRLPIEMEQGTVYYGGYYLSQLYAAKGVKKSTVKVNGATYNVDDVFVATSQSDDVFAQGQSIDPMFVAFAGAGSPIYIAAASDVSDGLPTWATALIVVAVVVVCAAAVAYVLLSKRRNAPKSTDGAQAPAPEQAQQPDAQQETAEPKQDEAESQEDEADQQ